MADNINEILRQFRQGTFKSRESAINTRANIFEGFLSDVEKQGKLLENAGVKGEVAGSILTGIMYAGLKVAAPTLVAANPWLIPVMFAGGAYFGAKAGQQGVDWVENFGGFFTDLLKKGDSADYEGQNKAMNDFVNKYKGSFISDDVMNSVNIINEGSAEQLKGSAIRGFTSGLKKAFNPLDKLIGQADTITPDVATKTGATNLQNLIGDKLFHNLEGPQQFSPVFQEGTSNIIGSEVTSPMAEGIPRAFTPTLANLFGSKMYSGIPGVGKYFDRGNIMNTLISNFSPKSFKRYNF